jgi:nicotinate phosphoribosyltransferase
MNQIHLQTLIASKAARVVAAAQGRNVVEFGARRIHGTGTAIQAARASFIAGATATSNVAAGQEFGLPVVGTMAHSYVQAFDTEMEAFRTFTSHFPDTTLVVDTYDTLEGVQRVVGLSRELGTEFHVQAIRLDSGDLAALAKASRKILDDAGLADVSIFASGGLDEDAIADVVASGAPIDAFGVGTRMGVSADAPSLEIAYKLAEFAGHGRVKLAPGKVVLPGRKQVFRAHKGGVNLGDTIGRADETLAGTPLLRQVMKAGARTAPQKPLGDIQAYAQEQIAALPPDVRGIGAANPAYPVSVSPALSDYKRRVEASLTG